ncbi:MAG: hypothetical protein DWQ04_02725 [Chloroflexi bacterium]|nr:MAG: hypothetical protein DWQ04_02725 [Chloroflexota bacterium]
MTGPHFVVFYYLIIYLTSINMFDLADPKFILGITTKEKHKLTAHTQLAWLTCAPTLGGVTLKNIK